MVVCMRGGIQYSVNCITIKCHMNLAFPVIWDPDKGGSSDPIGIGAVDVK
jgi:hypothetical protein